MSSSAPGSSGAMVMSRTVPRAACQKRSKSSTRWAPADSPADARHAWRRRETVLPGECREVPRRAGTCCSMRVASPSSAHNVRSTAAVTSVGSNAPTPCCASSVLTVSDTFGRALHHIVTGSAVHVNVEHGGRKQSARQVVMFSMLREAVAAGAKAVDGAVFDEQPGVVRHRIRATPARWRLAKYACRFLLIIIARSN